jgi:hypothetical protein
MHHPHTLSARDGDAARWLVFFFWLREESGVGSLPLFDFSVCVLRVIQSKVYFTFLQGAVVTLAEM